MGHTHIHTMGSSPSIMCCNPTASTAIAPSDTTVNDKLLSSTLTSKSKKCQVVNATAGTSFVSIDRVVSDKDLQALSIASQGLPLDPYFPQRKKAVCYVSIDGQGKCEFSPDSFILQSGDVNQSGAGGLRREYEPMPERLTGSPVFHDILRTFKQRCGIPDNSCIIANFHTTFPTESTMMGSQGGRRRKTVTGQGVHQDGVKFAAVFCLHRSDVDGIVNYVFKDAPTPDPAACCEDRENILFEAVLEPNKMVVWDDETVYHYVSPPCFHSEEGERTAIVLGWPGGTSLDASVFKCADPSAFTLDDSINGRDSRSGDSDSERRVRSDSEYSGSDSEASSSEPLLCEQPHGKLPARVGLQRPRPYNCAE